METQTLGAESKWMSHLCEEAVSERVSSGLGMPASYGSYGVQRRLHKIDETIDFRDMRILDLVCGNGSYTAELALLAGLSLWSRPANAAPESLPRAITAGTATGENLPFASQNFDAITVIEVLEHTDNERQVLEECFSALKPGGFLVLFVPNKLCPSESHPFYLGDLSLGPNVPLVSWLLDSVRKRFCQARICSQRRLLSLAHEAGCDHTRTSYIFPPWTRFACL